MKEVKMNTEYSYFHADVNSSLRHEKMAKNKAEHINHFKLLLTGL